MASLYFGLNLKILVLFCSSVNDQVNGVPLLLRFYNNKLE